MSEKTPKLNKPASQEAQTTQMDKFNNAMRKILSVPKKDLKKK